jgi:hypothetical protein
LEGATNKSLGLVLSSNSVGTYHVVASNEAGETTSNPTTVVMRGARNARRDFRYVYPGHSWEYNLGSDSLT